MAVSNRMNYNAVAPVGGNHVANAVRYAILAQQEIVRAVSVANEMTGAGATPANMENSTEFGLAVGQGAAFYTLITGLKTALMGITQASLSDLDAGG